jgi:hypothetical protein
VDEWKALDPICEVHQRQHAAQRGADALYTRQLLSSTGVVRVTELAQQILRKQSAEKSRVAAAAKYVNGAGEGSEHGQRDVYNARNLASV